MLDVGQFNYHKLMDFIEESFESLSHKSSRSALTNMDFFKTVTWCLKWYEERIRNDRHWPVLQHISIVDYNIYRCIVKRHCEALVAKYEHSWFFADEKYIRRLEHVHYILDNHFIYWEWKATPLLIGD